MATVKVTVDGKTFTLKDRGYGVFSGTLISPGTKDTAPGLYYPVQVDIYDEKGNLRYTETENENEQLRLYVENKTTSKVKIALKEKYSIRLQGV